MCKTLVVGRIRIHGAGINDSVSDRICVAEGTVDACDVREPREYEFPYAPGARIPASPWHRVANDERALDEDEAGAGTVDAWILKVPKDLLEPFVHAGVHDIERQADVARLMRSPAIADAIGDVTAFARSLATNTDGLKVQGIGVRVPGLTTTTVDTQRKVRIGLHVDSWDRSHPSETARARTRLNLNLGAGNRYLLLVDAPVDELWATRISAENPQVTVRGSSELARQHLAENPNQQVIRLCIGPCEAYIAPTELLPHDSSTLHKHEVDVSLTLLGHFRGPRPA
jgi:hypothetical protein